MPKKKWIDKKSSTTYHLVHRAQNDPLIHDSEAPPMVFKEIQAPNLRIPSTLTSLSTTDSSKIKTLTDLETELGDWAKACRGNEGEAANYGIYFDDTEYDYMQHLREIGATTNAVLVEAPKLKEKKPKDKLEDALASAAPEKNAKIQIPEELLPSSETIERTYQDQQDTPDALRGFQPGMDPRLREVLQALEDEAYVDDDEEVFEALAKSGKVSQYEFEEQEFEEEEGGWESDTTQKVTITATTNNHEPSPKASPSTPTDNNAPDQDPNQDWLIEYSKFKDAQKKPIFRQKTPNDSFSEVASSIRNLSFGTTASSYISTNKKRRQRRRKHGNALTASTGYSMSSSSLSRTEALTLLDDRFDRVEKLYALDEDDEEGDEPSDHDLHRLNDNEDDDVASVMTASTTHTSATTARSVKSTFVQETRSDFNSIMDEFLNSYTMGNRGRVKNMKPLTPIEQLDEIRRELGKPKTTPPQSGRGERVSGQA